MNEKTDTNQHFPIIEPFALFEVQQTVTSSKPNLRATN